MKCPTRGINIFLADIHVSGADIPAMKNMVQLETVALYCTRNCILGVLAGSALGIHN